MTKRILVTALIAIVALGAGIALGAGLDGDDGGDGGGSAATASSTTAAGGTDSGNGAEDDESDGDDDEGTTTTDGTPSDGPLPPPTVDEEGLEGEALALAQAINRAAGLTYHAVFEGTAGASGSDTSVGTIRVEVWRAPPKARRYTTIDLADRSIESVEIRTEDGVVGCSRLDPATPFDCRPNPDPEADPSAPLFDAVDPHAGTVTARDDEIAGSPVRCYVVVTETGVPPEACFDEAGIPALIDPGEGRLARVSVDTTVTDDVFTPPSD